MKRLLSIAILKHSLYPMLAALGAFIALTINLLSTAQGWYILDTKLLTTLYLAGIARNKLLLLVLIMLVGYISVRYIRPMSMKGAFSCGFVFVAVIALFF